MRNNVITIMIDSVFSECISNKKTRVSSTPFIDSLLNDSISCTNIYSLGPYTDAATIGLYSGTRTLSNLGYYYGINSTDENHFSVFHNNGFKTIALFYPYYLLSTKVRKNIDYTIYTSGFKYQSVWFGKFEYYSEIAKKRPLSEQEYSIIEKCLDLVFDCWLGFYKDIADNKYSSQIVKDLINDERYMLTGNVYLRNEYLLFCKNKKNYINGILQKGMNHPLAYINNFEYGKDKDVNFLKKIYRSHKRIIFDIKKSNLKLNIKNNKMDFNHFNKCIKEYFKTKDKNKLRYIVNYFMLILYPQLMIKRSLKQKFWQEMASMNKQIDVLFKTIDTERIDKQFYASLHVLEPHHNISFFSFDSFDMSMIQEEFEYIKPIINMCGDNFSGNLIYQLSLGYVDLCIKRLFKNLEDRNLLNCTTVMLVSDHGSSYFFNPVRDTVVNTFYKENYNVPLLIWNAKLPSDIKKAYCGKYMSIDVFPTLFDLCSVSYPEQYIGKPIFKLPNGRKYLITEYMGPGVPDMISKEVWISIRSDRYVIGYISKITESLDISRPEVIYDLRKDPNEMNNLAKIYSICNQSEMVELFELLNQRYNEIQIEMQKKLSNINEFNVI